MTSETILDIQQLTKIYDNGVHALNNVDLKIKKGEFVAIIGLSGSGKSTLLRCINRLIDPTGGTIQMGNTEITALRDRELRKTRRKIGMVFQHFNLVPRTSVLLNVLTGGLGTTATVKSVLGMFSEAEKKRALEKLDIVGLREKALERGEDLSGGQKQRVAIARTLYQDPEILLADEPVASLDPATSHSVMDYIKKANVEYGKTVLCNLHFLSLVRQYATRAIALKDGEVVFDGPTQDIREEMFKEIYGEDAKEITIH